MSGGTREGGRARVTIGLIADGLHRQLGREPTAAELADAVKGRRAASAKYRAADRAERDRVNTMVSAGGLPKKLREMNVANRVHREENIAFFKDQERRFPHRLQFVLEATVRDLKAGHISDPAYADSTSIHGALRKLNDMAKRDESAETMTRVASAKAARRALGNKTRMRVADKASKLKIGLTRERAAQLISKEVGLSEHRTLKILRALNLPKRSARK